jgi:purine-nucleoside phosphorylase
MIEDNAIVRPVRTKRTPVLGPLALLAASELDLQILRNGFNLPDSRALFLSRLYYNAADSKLPAVLGPLVGAPYAVMCLETLRAWGARQAIFIGWCGSIDERVRIGDIIVPAGAWIDEGTSGHYGLSGAKVVAPDEMLRSLLQQGLAQRRINFHNGLIWTTDGIFRETPDQVIKFRQQGALAVEMELSALLSAAAFYAFPLAGLLTVSDELFTLKWRPGFKTEAFCQSRSAVCDLAIDLMIMQSKV